MTSLVVTILGMGVVTYLVRLLPMQLVEHVALPDWAYRALRYVPTAVLTAILVPEILMVEGVLELSVQNLRLPAACLAAIVAWRTGNVLIVIVTGMAALWALQWLS